MKAQSTQGEETFIVMKWHDCVEGRRPVPRRRGASGRGAIAERPLPPAPLPPVRTPASPPSQIRRRSGGMATAGLMWQFDASQCTRSGKWGAGKNRRHGGLSTQHLSRMLALRLLSDAREGQHLAHRIQFSLPTPSSINRVCLFRIWERHALPGHPELLRRDPLPCFRPFQQYSYRQKRLESLISPG